MIRGTFANIRLRNALAGGREGPWTTHLPSSDEMTVYDAAMRYRDAAVPLVVLAGREYGSGSSRDWAAKGPAMLGIRAVIAESFERIHRSNLVGMGILPLEYPAGASAESLGLTGRESFTIRWPAGDPAPRRPFSVVARADDGSEIAFAAVSRLDGPIDIEYVRGGGILPTVLRRLATSAGSD
jgi:aconitate hydratase